MTTTGPQLDPTLLGAKVELDAIPVIDLRPFLHGTAQERIAVAHRIGAACRDIGFFAVVNHGVSRSLVRRTFDVCEEFFALPTEDKAAISIERSPCHRGWFAVGGENLDPAKQQYAGDFKEGIKIGQDLAPNHEFVQRGIKLQGPNLWPSRPPTFTPTLREYFYVLTNLARELVHALAIALDLPEQYFDEYFTCPMATAGPLHYPPQHGVITEQQIGAGAHTDYGCLTLLAQDSNGGLQVRSKQGGWIDVPPIEDAFVVNLGDMTARWTNDVFTSTMHRVVNTSGKDRYSIPFFFDPNWDAEVVALPTCVTDERPARYAPTTGLGHLLDMIDKTFVYHRELPDGETAP